VLAPGEYGWQVRRAAGEEACEPAYFTVAAPEAIDALRLRAGTAGDPAVDRLLLASALLAHDFAAAAVAVLEQDDALAPALAQLRATLLVKAAQRLGDLARVEAQAR
jgi:hypothetical protein